MRLVTFHKILSGPFVSSFVKLRPSTRLACFIMYPDLLGFITDIAVIEEGRTGMCGQIEEVYENLLKRSPVTMRVLSGMEEALAVLKKDKLVDRVTVKDHDVIFRFRGEEKEEADLLADLVGAGALIQSYTRDRIGINEMFRG